MRKIFLGTIISVLPVLSHADSLIEAVQTGKTSLDMRLRYEHVDQASLDADALTLRTRLNYTTADFKHWSAGLEFEDSRSVGVSDYFDTVDASKKGQYSVVADPETTELDQAYLQYSADGLKAKIGRQVLTMDGHRFVGHVGWRQDRQVFDGLSLSYQASEDWLLQYAYFNQRNRIFAQAKDQFSKDHLFSAAYNTGFGKLSAYGYFLELDNNTANALDTVGLRFKGAKKLESTKLLYALEFANQESESATAKRDADYSLLELGIVAAGVTAKLGYEVLGSDSGQYGFSTPLATLHKFNGWSDQFLATPGVGLQDIYVSLATKAAGGKLVLAYHDFSADESSATVDDLGSEINLLYAKKFAKHYSTGIKYASYSAGDAAAGKVDTDKVWVWAGFGF